MADPTECIICGGELHGTGEDLCFEHYDIWVQCYCEDDGVNYNFHEADKLFREDFGVVDA